jgi:hypothetical protein
MTDSELAQAYDKALFYGELNLYDEQVVKEHNQRLAVIKSSK